MKASKLEPPTLIKINNEESELAPTGYETKSDSSFFLLIIFKVYMLTITQISLCKTGCKLAL